MKPVGSKSNTASPRPHRVGNIADNLGAALVAAAAAVCLLASTPAHADTQTRTSAFDYDPTTGLLIKQIVEPGSSNYCVVTVNGYDNFGNINATSVRNCNGSTATFPGSSSSVNGEAASPDTGTADGKLAVFTNRVSAVSYTADGRFVQSTTVASDQSAPIKQQETRSYDPILNVLTKQTGPNGLSTQWAYDTFGRKILEQRADGNGTKLTYEYCQTAIYSAGTASCPIVNGVTAVYVTTSTPVAHADVTNPSSATVNGAYTKTYYDALYRAIRTETQSFDAIASKLIYQDTYYNDKGQITQSSRPYVSGATTIAWTYYTYDQLGRSTITTQQYTAQTNSQTKVDYNGLVTTITDDQSHQTIETRNVAGLVDNIQDAKGFKLSKTWDAFGNLLTTTDSKGNVVRLGYDPKGRKTSMQDPDMGSWTYAYNALGEFVQQTDAKSQVTNLTYDVLGRMTQKTEPSLNAYWYYDQTKSGASCGTGIGKLCETSSSNGYDSISHYDSVGRFDSVQTKIGATTYSFGYTYTTDGRLLTTTYPTGLVLKNGYTALGYLRSVGDGTSGSLYWRANGVDAEGHVTSQLFGNLLQTINSFDPYTGRLTKTQTGTSGSVQNVTYHYDTLGNPDSIIDTVQQSTELYTYDELNRLHTESRLGIAVTSPKLTTWDYDDIGNIKNVTGIGAYSYTGTKPHAITKAYLVNGVFNTSYGYDGNGNLQTAAAAGLNRTVTWTSFNKVQSITQVSGSTTNVMAYLYGPSGDRVQETFTQNGTLKRTTNYLNPGAGSGLLYEEEITPTTTKKKHYLNAGGMTFAALVYDTASSAWTQQYWHKDNLGSTVVVTDSVGAVTERLTYEPFGKRRNTDETADLLGTLQAQTTRRGFTGHEMIDEVGLVNMNGRIYDPAISRFLSADPMIESPSNLQSYNRYSYLQNNPLTGIDPSGYFGLKDIGHIVNNAREALGHPYVHAWKMAYKDQVGRAIIAITVAILTDGAATSMMSDWILCTTAGATYGPLIAAAAGGFAGGLAGSNGHLKAGVNGAATAAAFYAVGSATDMHNPDYSQVSTEQYLTNAAGHALVGCASSVANGGECGSGAASAGISALATPYYSQDGLIAAFQAAAIGGTTSVIGGGKFTNGAITGAYGYLYNACGKDPHGCLNIGSGLGAATGVGLAAGCDIGSAGACVVANPGIITAAAGVGAVLGGVADSISNAIDNFVHGNSWLNNTPTTVYQLVYNNSTDVYKYGITSAADPYTRYSASYYATNNVHMEIIATFDNRAPARMLEYGLCASYAATNGSIPRGSSRC